MLCISLNFTTVHDFLDNTMHVVQPATFPCSCQEITATLYIVIADFQTEGISVFIDPISVLSRVAGKQHSTLNTTIHKVYLLGRNIDMRDFSTASLYTEYAVSRLMMNF